MKRTARQVSADPMVVFLPRRLADGRYREWDFKRAKAWDSHRLLHSDDHVLVAHPFLLFDSSDLFHGAARWNDSQLFTSPDQPRQSIEIRFRCRCDPEKCDDCQLSPVSHAFRRGNLTNEKHRISGSQYPL